MPYYCSDALLNAVENTVLHWVFGHVLVSSFHTVCGSLEKNVNRLLRLQLPSTQILHIEKGQTKSIQHGVDLKQIKLTGDQLKHLVKDTSNKYNLGI